MGRLPASYFINASELFKQIIPAYEYHVHTSYTDGMNSVAEIVDEAINIGLQRLIFTEHTEPWFAKKENWFPQYAEEINNIRNKYLETIDIKIGIEAPAIDFAGNIEITDEMSVRCEYLLGAAHRYPGIEGRRVKDLSANEAIELEYKTLMGIASNNNFDAIAHIGGTCLKYCSEFPLSLTTDIIKEAVKNDIAIEINHQYHKPVNNILNICIEENAKIVLGSNAHKLIEIGSVYKVIKELYGN